MFLQKFDIFKNKRSIIRANVSPTEPNLPDLMVPLKVDGNEKRGGSGR